jgi:hypothetical protein
LGWGLVGAVIALAVSRIVLWAYSLYHINAFQKIHFDWMFFIKNTLLAIVLSFGVYLISSKLFVLEDAMRMTNLLYLLMVGIVYYCIIAAVNYKTIRVLI